MMRNGRLAEVINGPGRLTYQFAVACMLILTASTTVFAQATTDVQTAFAEQLDSLERTWTKGGNPEYFVSAKKVANELKGFGGDEAANAAALLDTLLRKNVESVQVGTTDLAAKASAAREILRAEDETASARAADVKALAGFLGAIRRELIADFVARPVVANVSPPIGGGPRMAGMNPNAIADPVAREAYKAAILENSRNAVLNSRQIVLRDLQADLSQPIIDRLKRFANTDAVGLSLVQEWVETAKLTDAERARVFDSRSP
jgi:hypothetical protein